MTLPPDRVDYVPRCPDNPRYIWGEPEPETDCDDETEDCDDEPERP